MDIFQYPLTARSFNVWLLIGLWKLARSNLCLTVSTIVSQGDFPWLVAKKWACCIYVKIAIVVEKVHEGFTVLVLTSTAVTKIANTFDLRQFVLDVKLDSSLQLMNKTDVILQIIKNDAQWDVMKYTIFFEIYHYRMHVTVVLVPVISLDFILYHRVIKSPKKWCTPSLLSSPSSVWDAELSS